MLNNYFNVTVWAFIHGKFTLMEMPRQADNDPVEDVTVKHIDQY